MKKQFLFLLLFVSTFSFSQSINDYKAVIVSSKFEFLKSENQYRLSTLSKFNLEKAGFKVYYSNQNLSQEITERCKVLNYDVVKINHLLLTKLYIVFKDCYDRVVFQSELGVSREKDYEKAYTEALNNAFESVYELNYKYNDKKSDDVKTETETVPAVEKEVVETVKEVVADEIEVAESAFVNQEILYAQPITNGFQLVDDKPSVVMKIFKTSNKSCFLAQKGDIQGVLVSKWEQWFFEYYKDDKLISEKINVKF